MVAPNDTDSAALTSDTADAALVAALRAGDEAAFRGLVRRYHAALVRLARVSVSSEAVAEEVAQETWLAVIQGIDGFEGRSSLKSWIFAILVNRARSRGVREQRIVPMSSLGGEGDDDAPAVDADITCRELVAVITDFLEGALPVQERDLVERHLAMCTWCATYLEQMRHTLMVVGQLREDDVPPPMLDALARAFRAQRAGPDDA